MAKSGGAGKREGSAFSYGVEDKDIAMQPPNMFRLKEQVRNVSAGHTGPSGAENPREVGGNTEAKLKTRRP